VLYKGVGGGDEVGDGGEKADERIGVFVGD